MRKLYIALGILGVVGAGAVIWYLTRNAANGYVDLNSYFVETVGNYNIFKKYYAVTNSFTYWAQYPNVLSSPEFPTVAETKAWITAQG